MQHELDSLGLSAATVRDDSRDEYIRTVHDQSCAWVVECSRRYCPMASRYRDGRLIGNAEPNRLIFFGIRLLWLW